MKQKHRNIKKQCLKQQQNEEEKKNMTYMKTQRKRFIKE